jgi:hypothetical protein
MLIDHKIGNHTFLLNEVEQAICKLSSRHIGSSVSSWDWEVFLAASISNPGQEKWFQFAHALENKMHSLCSNLSDGLNGLFYQNMLSNFSRISLIDVKLALTGKGASAGSLVTSDQYSVENLLNSLNIASSC